MVYFVGAGPGATDLITVRGLKLLQEADIVVYAGSLVNPELLKETKKTCEIYNSAVMTLEEVIAVLKRSASEQKQIVRLHTGDPVFMGAVKEQMDELERIGVLYEVCPGVSSFCVRSGGAASRIYASSVSQTVIITRMPGRTPVPEKEEMKALASHGATMVIFLSTGLLKELRESCCKDIIRRDSMCIGL